MQVCCLSHAASTSVLRLISNERILFGCPGNRAAGENKQYKKMKKNFIYTVAFLLCGVLSFSSCEDLLNVESNRVEYEFEDWTLNDSVYSVLGILKSVQAVGDRQVLLNELRADLITVNDAKAVVDVKQLSNFIYDLETNPYLDVKDYYAIINNCNIYLARVDTTLEKNHVKLMMPEYVAVKSMRAWTYLQLAINYESVPYFTEPILTHSAAEKVMNQPMLSREQLMTNLINEMLPYENPAVYPMPAWDNDGKVLKFGYGNGVDVATKQLFMPVRMLLGELHLWRASAGDYIKAAKFFYDQITGAGTNETAPKYTDKNYVIKYTAEGGKNISDNYSKRYALKDFAAQSDNSVLMLIPYAKSELIGTISNLASVFSPENDNGGAQVFASPGMISLAERQVYRYAKGEDLKKPDLVEYSNEKDYEYSGDLRIKATTYSQTDDDEALTEYNNIIAKFNLETGGFGSLDAFHTPGVRTTCIVLQRPEHAYLRFAEALVGMAREGYTGALELAMEVLKVGVKDKYSVLKNPVYAERYKLNANGDTLKRYQIDKLTKDTLGFEYVMEEYLASYDDSLGYNFTDLAFDGNVGIHSRGSGDSERNIYYALNDTCVARYIGEIEMQDKVEVLTREITDEDYINYVSDLIIDELALEFAWEGTRYGDLVRFAKAMGDNDVIAKRIAGRDFINEVSYRHPEFQYEPSIYAKFSSESNWYLPLPGGVVEPTDPEDLPVEGIPTVDAE